MRSILHIVAFLLLATGPCSASADDQLLEEIETLRLAGELAEAQALSEQALEDSPSSRGAVALHLALAKIHDRYGLHNNTRPVVEALNHVKMAATVVEPGDAQSAARIELAFANYFYRAEMREREFSAAMRHVELAVGMFQVIEDWHGAAEAVHTLGLIRMQQGRYAEARELFDESFALDARDGRRVFFVGEYERHIGFVDRFTGNMAAAIPHFERSLAARREAGAIDASLFAAVSLASTLLETGRAAEAGEYLTYALDVATGIGSDYGTAITLLAQGQYYLELGRSGEARVAFERAVEVARRIRSETIERRATEALTAL